MAIDIKANIFRLGQSISLDFWETTMVKPRDNKIPTSINKYNSAARLRKNFIFILRINS